MLTVEKLKTENKKHVTFAADVGEKENEFMPLYKKNKAQLNYALMQKHLFKFFCKERYEEFTNYLKLYTVQELEKFFKLEGRSFFIVALNTFSSNSYPLDFLLQTIPKNIICQILAEEDFSILGSFFATQGATKKYGDYSEIQKTTASEKIKILLNMGIQTINEFIKNNVPDFLEQSVQGTSSKYE